MKKVLLLFTIIVCVSCCASNAGFIYKEHQGIVLDSDPGRSANYELLEITGPDGRNLYQDGIALVVKYPIVTTWGGEGPAKYIPLLVSENDIDKNMAFEKAFVSVKDHPEFLSRNDAFMVALRARIILLNSR